MRYLHTMIRVANLEATLDFFVAKLGLVENQYLGKIDGWLLEKCDECHRSNHSVCCLPRIEYKVRPSFSPAKK